MGINVELRTETGEVLERVDDLHGVLADAACSQLADARLLRYVVPWGDAVFNQAQAPDLQADIRAVREARAGTPLERMLAQVEPLVDGLATHPHRSLWFVGD